MPATDGELNARASLEYGEHLPATMPNPAIQTLRMLSLALCRLPRTRDLVG